MTYLSLSSVGPNHHQGRQLDDSWKSSCGHLVTARVDLRVTRLWHSGGTDTTIRGRSKKIQSKCRVWATVVLGPHDRSQLAMGSLQRHALWPLLQWGLWKAGETFHGGHVSGRFQVRNPIGGTVTSVFLPQTSWIPGKDAKWVYKIPRKSPQEVWLNLQRSSNHWFSK